MKIALASSVNFQLIFTLFTHCI